MHMRKFQCSLYCTVMCGGFCSFHIKNHLRANNFYYFNQVSFHTGCELYYRLPFLLGFKYNAQLSTSLTFVVPNQHTPAEGTSLDTNSDGAFSLFISSFWGCC